MSRMVIIYNERDNFVKLEKITNVLFTIITSWFFYIICVMMLQTYHEHLERWARKRLQKLLPTKKMEKVYAPWQVI